MSVPRVRLEKCEKIGDSLWLLDEEQKKHIVKALRLYEGAVVEGLLDARRGEHFEMRLVRDDRRYLLQELNSRHEQPVIPRITLLIGLLKSDQFEPLLRSCAEIGLHRIQPLVCERSVPRIAAQQITPKLSRWGKILQEGTKVSGSALVPRLEPPIPFADCRFAELPPERYAALLSPDALPINKVPNDLEEVAVAVGPEGDWGDGEAACLLDNGFTPVSLGSRILRASTAAALACGYLSLSNVK